MAPAPHILLYAHMSKRVSYQHYYWIDYRRQMGAIHGTAMIVIPNRKKVSFVFNPEAVDLLMNL